MNLNDAASLWQRVEAARREEEVTKRHHERATKAKDAAIITRGEAEKAWDAFADQADPVDVERAIQLAQPLVYEEELAALGTPRLASGSGA